MTCRGPATATAPSATSPSALRGEGRKPYVVPYGVSNPLGAVAYATTIAEIAAPVGALGFAPAAIVHCSGSAGTQAGLVVGAAVALPDTRIVGIDIDAEPERVRADVVRYATGAADLLDAPVRRRRRGGRRRPRRPGLRRPARRHIEAIRLAGRLEALALDPVYSGKGLAGLIALIRQGRWRKERMSSSCTCYQRVFVAAADDPLGRLRGPLAIRRLLGRPWFAWLAVFLPGSEEGRWLASLGVAPEIIKLSSETEALAAVRAGEGTMLALAHIVRVEVHSGALVRLPVAELRSLAVVGQHAGPAQDHDHGPHLAAVRRHRRCHGGDGRPRRLARAGAPRLKVPRRPVELTGPARR